MGLPRVPAARPCTTGTKKGLQQLLALYVPALAAAAPALANTYVPLASSIHVQT